MDRFYHHGNDLSGGTSRFPVQRRDRKPEDPVQAVLICPEDAIIGVVM